MSRPIADSISALSSASPTLPWTGDAGVEPSVGSVGDSYDNVLAESIIGMLKTYPRSFNLDADLLVQATDALLECAQACTACADACLAEDDVAAMVKCIRTNLDCADICDATMRVVSRQTEYDANVTRAQLEACAQACKSCGDECEQHAQHGMEHCRVCADACRRCEDACQRLIDAAA